MGFGKVDFWNTGFAGAPADITRLNIVIKLVDWCRTHICVVWLEPMSLKNLIWAARKDSC